MFSSSRCRLAALSGRHTSLVLPVKHKASNRSFASESMNRGDPTMGLVFSIIGINTAVFAWWQIDGPQAKYLVQHFVTSPAHMQAGRFDSLILSSFSHVRPMEFVLNMLTFFFFGRVVFYNLGHLPGLGLYLGGGVFGALINNYGWDLKSPGTPTLGASAAISSLVGYSVMNWPRRIVRLDGIIPVPLALFGLGYIGITQMSSGSLKGIEHNSSIAGASFGVLGFFMFRLLSRGRF